MKDYISSPDLYAMNDSMLERELEYWRKEFGRSSSERSAKMCEATYKELESRRKSDK